jgi:hypothetical protein
MISEIPRVALDTTLYKNNSDEHVVATDIASLAIEARRSSDTIDPQRIWWFDRLPKNLSISRSDFPSSIASLDVGRIIDATPEESQRLILLVSPAYNFPEARIDLYFVHKSDGQTSFDAFGIPVRETSQVTENRLQQFVPRSDTPGVPRLTGFDAVMTPLYATTDLEENLFQTAKLWIDLPDNIWEQMSSGRVKEHCQELTNDMIPVAIALQGELKSGQDPHRVGANAESRMAEASGNDIDFSGSGCGVSNYEVVFDRSSYSSVEASDQTIFVVHCGRCCGPIGKYMKPGDQCPHCRSELPRKMSAGKVVSERRYPQNPATESSLELYQIQIAPVASWGWLSDWWRSLSIAA